jgi:hypothetical protein
MKKSYRFILAALFFTALTGILVALYLYNLEPRDLRNVKPDFAISAGDLLKAFKNDEKEATAQYVNRILEVSGIIQSVKSGENNALSISLKTGNDLSSVICTLQGNTDPSDFKTGEQIILRGECSGFLMDVLLNNCSVIQDNN